jgi:hypothetical protein
VLLAAEFNVDDEFAEELVADTVPDVLAVFTRIVGTFTRPLLPVVPV